MKLRAALASILLAATTLAAQSPPPPAKRLPPAGIEIPAEARAELRAGAAALRADIDAVARELASGKNQNLLALLPDVEVFHKAVDWALRYDEFFDVKQIATARKALASGRERVAHLRAGKAPWLDATGLIVRGHRSKLDDSIQPYGLFVPPSSGSPASGLRPPASASSPAGARRMMVWLLGRGEKRTELVFIAEREAGPPQLTPADTLTLVPYGRYCNATKFAGEVDVFEAMDAVRAQYRIDPARIIVAGFSMGGASTWHLATHHAGLWCAASPGAGFAETAIYNRIFAPGKPPRTPWEQTLWHWYNARDVAGNLFNVPTIAYSGELDPQKQSADLMEEAAAKEGLKLERLIGPKTEHRYHPETKQVLTARLEALMAKGRDPRPREVRWTTYTTRYPGESWVRILGMEKHWERAEVRARIEDGGRTIGVETKNVSRLWIEQMRPSAHFEGTITIDGQRVPFLANREVPTFAIKTAGRWQEVRADDPSAQLLHKTHGRSGPIDDAFMDPFLFVRPTGKPLNEKIGAWVAGELAHATKIWRDIFRAELQVKDDTAVTSEEFATKNLILFGDASSNTLIARILAAEKSPLAWDAHQLTFRGKTYDAAHHAPVLVFPNPLSARRRYVVLNSGIDFRDEAYGTNSLQTPKLPDYAIIDLREPPGPRWPGRIVDAGFFDESWK